MSICTSHFVWCNIDKIEFFFLDIQNLKKKAVFMFVPFKYSLFNNLLVLIILQTILKKKNVAKLCHPFHKV